MTREQILNGVQEIFRDVFDEEDLIVEESSNSDTIEDWDSLNHINLVSAIEMEFGIRFALGELTSLKNVGDMIDLMLKKLAK